MASKPDPDPELPEIENLAINQPIIGDSHRDIQQVLELDPKDEEDFKKWLELGSKIIIMVMGETGVGKSTLLNALVGHAVFETGRSKKQAVTTRVTEHKCKKNGVEIVAIDCPGLHDGTVNEDVYLQEMYDKIHAHGRINLFLYCKKMTDTRADPKGDADIITKLTHKLGEEIWQHTLFALTFANIYEKRMKKHNHKQADITVQFKQKKREWKKHFRETLKTCGIDLVNCNIKVCAAGDKQRQLCEKAYWLSDFWASAYKVLDVNGALAFLRLNQSRVVENAPEESFQQDLHAQPLVTTNKLLVALGIATTIGAAIGARIGPKPVCKTIGIITFGATAGNGVVMGTVATAAIGLAIGVAILAQYRKRRAESNRSS